MKLDIEVYSYLLNQIIKRLKEEYKNHPKTFEKTFGFPLNYDLLTDFKNYVDFVEVYIREYIRLIDENIKDITNGLNERVFNSMKVECALKNEEFISKKSLIDFKTNIISVLQQFENYFETFKQTHSKYKEENIIINGYIEDVKRIIFKFFTINQTENKEINEND